MHKNWFAKKVNSVAQCLWMETTGDGDWGGECDDTMESWELRWCNWADLRLRWEQWEPEEKNLSCDWSAIRKLELAVWVKLCSHHHVEWWKAKRKPEVHEEKPWRVLYGKMKTYRQQKDIDILGRDPVWPLAPLGGPEALLQHIIGRRSSRMAFMLLGKGADRVKRITRVHSKWCNWLHTKTWLYLWVLITMRATTLYSPLEWAQTAHRIMMSGHRMQLVLYHFDQFDSHVSQAPVFCRKSVPVTGHKAQCWTGPTCDNAKRPKIYSKTDVFAWFANFGLCGLPLPPIGCKYFPKLPIQALSKLLSVEILALSWSLAACVEVSNWSNVSQSQGCVELIKMVQ